MKRFLSLLLLLFMAINSFGANEYYDFMDDNGLYYKIKSVDDKTCEVVNPYGPNGRGAPYSGDVAISSSVTYNGVVFCVKSIGINAFNQSRITSITIPSSVISIESSAFLGCYLTSITIPSSVTTIGDAAFSGCRQLKSIIIPSSVTFIGGAAFSGCSVLKSITIPDCVTSIYNYTFSGCYSLKSIIIPSSVTSIGICVFSGCASLTSITIPNSVTSIGSHAFENCSGLTSVAIPNGITSIDGYFSGCSSLTSVSIPNSVTTIGGKAFQNCSSLASVTIPNSVTTIGDKAFQNCSSLASVTIPNGVTNIGNSAFEGCSSFRSITIPSSVKTIGDSAFSGCEISKEKLYNQSSIDLLSCGLTVYDEITESGICINENVIVKYKGTDTEIAIPSGVTTIGDSVFKNCHKLKSIILPNSVTDIGIKAFNGCYNLMYISCSNPIPPTCDGLETFVSESNLRDKYDIYNYVTLHVPMGSKDLYSSAHEWRYFKNIKEDANIDGTTFYAKLRIKQANGGYTEQYVKADEEYTIYFGGEARARINTVMLNDRDFCIIRRGCNRYESVR